MSQLGYNFHLLVKTHKQGSQNTQASRMKILNLVADQLLRSGFKLKNSKGLKTKHIEHLVQRWKEEGLSPSTLKNRLSILRWTAKIIGKQNIVLRTNDAYGINRRQHKPEGKAKELDMSKLHQITDRHIYFSLLLQKELGLRREESIKFNVSYAMRGNLIRLKKSWTKGGKAREIPVTKESQHKLLTEIAQFCKGKSLIPSDKNYIQQLKVYEYQTNRVGLNKNHGLRHMYARSRYLAITGWQCPADGGLHRKELSMEDREIDYQARMAISKELGHTRFSITYAYLGS